MVSNKKHPLEGIRVLDLGRYQAGPRCALMFARMGAEVIKIESLTGDESRKNPPVVRGQSAYWVQYNSGKKSLSINLRTDEGKEVLKDLVAHSDIFLQNFRPGTIDKMGFGYETLKKLNEKIFIGLPKKVLADIENEPKNKLGEFVVVVEGVRKTSKLNNFINIEIENQINKLLEKFSLTDVVEIVHKISYIGKKEIYKKALKLKK